MLAAADVLVLAAVVVGLFWLLAPVRRRLEGWLAARLRPRRPSARRRVVVLGRRPDGTYGREDGE